MWGVVVVVTDGNIEMLLEVESAGGKTAMMHPDL
jgi:hypothetical protein